MRFLDRNGWEYVEHRTAPEAAMIVALTAHGEIVLAEEFRPPLKAPVVSLPAGLVGDEGPEDASDAARREQAPHDRGKITVHVVPVEKLRAWAKARETEGKIIDPRIWAGLYLAGMP